MKTFLHILPLLAAMFVGSCTFEPASEDVSVSFDVNLEMTSKAAHDNDALAANVNRCVLQVWCNNNITQTIVETAEPGSNHFEFRGVILEADTNYDFLFWADCGKPSGEDLYYYTESLRNVTLTNPNAANNDALDAFCNKITGFNTDTDCAQSLTLYRPLAQLNIIANDLAELNKIPNEENFTPVSASCTYYGCTSFDVLRNCSTDEATLIEINDAALYGKEFSQTSAFTLVMLYAFPMDGASVAPVTFTVKNKNGSSVSTTINDVPLKSNYRTNIFGNILTTKGDIKILVKPLSIGESEITDVVTD